ncbi:thioesterase family protein [Saccharopolyspora shandongensis]|uniref:acyl-CoA thioesterase n=1 Tax=Saccharopolyspora shandongensis TaxID=418495 RepID=UPI00343685DF
MRRQPGSRTVAHRWDRLAGAARPLTFPRRAAEVVYDRPLAHGDEIETRLGVERVGRTSVTYSWHALRDGQLCVEGRHSVVHVDGTGRPAPWPEGHRPALG